MLVTNRHWKWIVKDEDTGCWRMCVTCNRAGKAGRAIMDGQASRRAIQDAESGENE